MFDLYRQALLMCINVLTLKIEKKKPTRLLYSTSDARQSISCVQGVLRDHCLFLVDLIYGCSRVISSPKQLRIKYNETQNQRGNLNQDRRVTTCICFPRPKGAEETESTSVWVVQKR